MKNFLMRKELAWHKSHKDFKCETNWNYTFCIIEFKVNLCIVRLKKIYFTASFESFDVLFKCVCENNVRF